MFDQITLNKIKIAAIMYFEENGIAAHDVDVRATAESLAVMMTARILARDVTTRTIEYPADWWSAFKVQHFPPWALRRWPPKMERITCRVMETFPSLDVKIPQHISSMTIALQRSINKP